MAGFVLCSLAAVLVTAVLVTIERGRVPAHRFTPRPWSELDGWEAGDPPAWSDAEVPDWAWVDLDWAAQMDAASASADRAARWAVLDAAYQSSDALYKRQPTGPDMFTEAWTDWRDKWSTSLDEIDAARAGWKWASARWEAAMALPC